jgi:hypothetical protein
MSSTQQRQELAKIRRQQVKAQQEWIARSNRPDYIDPEWARVGLFDVIPEAEQIANGDRLLKGRTPVVYGNHFFSWRAHDYLFAAYQEETILRDAMNRIVGFTYTSDNLHWTPHAIERLWQRYGEGITAKNYQANLGLAQLESYIKQLRGLAKSSLLDDNQQALRTDLIVPYRDGALLGSVRLGESQFGYKNNKPFCGGRTLHFCAHTWISGEQMRPEQRQVCQAILANDIDQAVQLMNKNDFRIEALDEDIMTDRFQKQFTKTFKQVREFA